MVNESDSGLRAAIGLCALLLHALACGSTPSPEPVGDSTDHQVETGIGTEPGPTPGAGDGSGSNPLPSHLKPPYEGLLAGAAVESIVPTLDRDPIYLAGYGARTSPASSLDDARPITARALALSDGGNDPVVLVALDVLAVDDSTMTLLRHEAALASWIPESAIHIASTHTHTAPGARAFPVWEPVLQRPSARWINDVLVPSTTRAVAAAVRDMQPATLQWASRDVEPTAGALPCANRHGLPYYDRSVEVLEARTPSGATIATAFSHGCHPVAMGGVTVVSADWPADARRRIEERRGGVAIFFQGFAGDVDPFGKVPRGQDGVLARQVGEAIGDTAVAALEGASHAIRGTIQTTSAQASLRFEPKRAPPKILGPAAVQRWRDLMSQEAHDGTLEEGLAMKSSSITIGAFRILAFQHEMIGEWAPRMRARLPDEHVMLLGYMDGVASYVPDDSMVHDHGDHNYEGHVSFYLYGHRGPFASGADATLLSLVEPEPRPTTP